MAHLEDLHPGSYLVFKGLDVNRKIMNKGNNLSLAVLKGEGDVDEKARFKKYYKEKRTRKKAKKAKKSTQ
jgi:hypothetical protein